ncbi:MAG: hypothetical protein ACLSXY_04055 [Veillonella sp.]
MACRCCNRTKQTRPAVINALAMLASKRENRAPKKHGNIPL